MRQDKGFVNEQGKFEHEVPDVVGFLYEEGISILQEAGYQVQICPSSFHSGRCSRVLRQKLQRNKVVELIIGDEFYDDPTLEKEVKNNGLQDHR